MGAAADGVAAPELAAAGAADVVAPEADGIVAVDKSAAGAAAAAGVAAGAAEEDAGAAEADPPWRKKCVQEGLHQHICRQNFCVVCWNVML